MTMQPLSGTVENFDPEYVLTRFKISEAIHRNANGSMCTSVLGGLDRVRYESGNVWQKAHRAS